ncbi:hypothetical protein PSECIP111951_00777 [Pseudoalteromonas holothuriae]|uniref:Uncharacterized protein n=1 Tax=Pseudoalteromonas holothuriae TaxID=2963714 RepID=A0A9W4W3D4_9GAMM|nr:MULTISPECIES: hypothetical protein [unclassified Pseudoalteromonas]CAH9053218.1 hypothetical protein PSECIP111951_00777 [Pseudoalteromonas sp. CIP111951]CAH9056306.1 hypothetical protein PSECIP111854_01766 [Pseudoalteromonas sp. CIP111854]
MVKQNISDTKQSNLWHNEHERLQFAELVNVFYAREILLLAKQYNGEQLQKKLLSLPYYVERAARHISQGDVPLELDSQNACWLAPQKKAQPQFNEQNNKSFYSVHTPVGLVVPILVNNAGYTQVVMDSIDQVRDNAIHCNQYGWFASSGLSHQSDTKLLKPTKLLMVCACCGHRWQYKKVVVPRVLSLREMLLASMINWTNVKVPKLRPH